MGGDGACSMTRDQERGGDASGGNHSDCAEHHRAVLRAAILGDSDVLRARRWTVDVVRRGIWPPCCAPPADLTDRASENGPGNKLQLVVVIAFPRWCSP